MVVAIAEVIHFTSLHPVLIDFFPQKSPPSGRGVTEQLGCKQWDFCYGCLCITYGCTVNTCHSGLSFKNHLDLNCETCDPTFHGSLCSHETGAQSMRLHLSLDTTDRGLLPTFVKDMQPFGRHNK